MADASATPGIGLAIEGGDGELRRETRVVLPEGKG